LSENGLSDSLIGSASIVSGPADGSAIMFLKRLLAASLLTFALGFGWGAASAQVYPDRLIKVIVPFVPGSPVDAAARVITQHIQTRLGQNMVIENKPGGGTTIGLKAVMAAPADSYTLLFIGPNLVYTPVLYPSMNFDPFRSLAPLASVVSYSHVMVVAPAVPATTVKELVTHIKANPGKVTFGYGLATTAHILSETFRQVTGADFAGIPYRGGEQRADLLGGRIDINMAPTANLLALIQDGKTRPLAFTGPKRSPDLPDVPTMTESGFPEVGYNPDVWLGFLAPIGTPDAVVHPINKAVAEALASAEMKAVLSKLGFDPMVTTPEQFGAFIANELSKWPPLLQAAGLKAE
jgi:tripartite-type tricarboxylate transporter receptor subunit TctC